MVCGDDKSRCDALQCTALRDIFMCPVLIVADGDDDEPDRPAPVDALSLCPLRAGADCGPWENVSVGCNIPFVLGATRSGAGCDV